MNNQEDFSAGHAAIQPDVAVDVTIEKAETVDAVDQQIAKILGQASLDFIERTVSKHFGDGYQSSDLGLIEKINLILALASKKKIAVSPRLLRAIRDVNAILPNGKIDAAYLARLKGEKRKHLLQIISSLILLLSFGFSIGKGLVAKSQDAENKTKIELSSSVIDDEKAKALEAEAKFDRLFSNDLETVVAEMGWEDFLSEYAVMNNENIWPAEKVFQLLRTQEPRYWGYYAVAYPKVFLDVVDSSQVSLVEFMSSCGADRFFKYLRMQMDDEVSWLNLWSINELFETLKTTNPNWGEIVAYNQSLFAGALDKEDLVLLVRMLTNPASSSSLNYFLRDYDGDWDKTWSRRELLDVMKDNGISWEIYAQRYMYLFKKEITPEELSKIIVYIAQNSSGFYPNSNDLNIFSNYYSLKLYKIIEPAAFIQIIETHFGQDVVNQMKSNYPELYQLEKSSIDELFETEAIYYVFDNYEDWKSVYSIVDIMTFLRGSGEKNNYSFIISYPQLFQDVSLTDEEVIILAYRNGRSSPSDEKMQFFQNYEGKSGWENQISMERLLAIGREDPNTGMYLEAIYFPEIFLPHFTEEDMYHLVLFTTFEFEKLDVLKTMDPIWQPFITLERRRSMLELAKNDSKYDWKEFVGYNYYLFEDVLNFDEAKDILSENYFSSIRNSPLWQSNVTPELEYTFFKESNEDIFNYILATEPTFFGDRLTQDDKLKVLKNNPEKVLENYHFWRQSFSPEFILDYFHSGQGRDDYGRLVLENKQIFGHLFYSGEYNLKNSIVHGGVNVLFNMDYDTNQPLYEEWSEFMSLEDAFYILEGFEEGKVKILTRPDLFFESVEFSDLNQFLQTKYGVTTLLNNYDGWQKLWSLVDIYEAAKTNESSFSAHAFFNSEYATDFIELTEHEDLSFLIRSYPDDFSYLFGNDLEMFAKKWTAAEILTALKQEHPSTWGAFVMEKSSFFDALISKYDLELLIQHGASPSGLVNAGLWEISEIFDAYKSGLPEKWGEIILTNSELFMDEVIRRDISLQQLLQTTDPVVANEFMYYWRSVWSEDEIEAAINEVFGDTFPTDSRGED